MRLLVDTNVVARIAQGDHPQHAVAIEAIAKLAEIGFRPIIVPQFVYEFWTVATRPIEVNGLGMSSAQAEVELQATSGYFRILRDERGIYEIWRELIVRYRVIGKRTHDARLVAAMLRHRITHLLTFNTSHFTPFTEIQAIDPERTEEFVLPD
jgi:predicted nucleic acid-binding protein